jgi:putative DNA primase/helicase
LAEWCQLREVPLTRASCADAVAAVADDNRFHPIREYLDGLAWDGTPRLATWLSTHLGAVVEPGCDKPEARPAYIREVGRKWPIGAVARVYRPGCKVDAAPIFEGGQGIGKSQALAALVPCPEWFCDEISDLGTKDSAQDLRGKWIIELAELSAMRRGDIERTKAFMSRSTDHYRPSYGRRSQDFPRQCAFAGTTNADGYLGDETGNRRFWPVKVGAIDLDAIRRDREQL